MSDDRPTMGLGLLHEGLAVEAPGLEDDGHVEEVGEGLGVTVELPVFEGEAPQVGAEHESEGCQFTPTKKQLLRTVVPGDEGGRGSRN